MASATRSSDGERSFHCCQYKRDPARARRVEVDQLPGLLVRMCLQVRNHSPAEPEPYGMKEVGRSGHVVHRGMQRAAGAPAQVAVLEIVLAVEDDDRRAGEGRRADPAGEPAGRERGGGHAPVRHASQRARRAARHRLGISGDGRHGRALPQQRAGVGLVLAVDVEAQRAGERGERVEHPGGERIRVDRKGNRRYGAVPVAVELTAGIGREQRDLAGQPQYRLARGRHPHGLTAHQQHSSGRLLERFESLADSGRGDVQGTGRPIERAFGHRGAQCGQLREVELHIQ